MLATEFIPHAVKLKVLQKLIKHEKIETTVKCGHIDDWMKRDAIRMLDELGDEPPMAVITC